MISAVRRWVRSRDDLHDFQNEAVGFLDVNPFSALFIDVGMGKSVISITMLANLKLRGWSGRALVIAPLRVARATWPTELAEWRQGNGISYQLIRATDKDPEVVAVYRETYDRVRAAELRVGETPAVASAIAARKAGATRVAVKEAIRQRQCLNPVDLHIVNTERVEWLVEYWERRGRETGEVWPYDVVIVDEASKFKDASTARWKALNRARSRITRLHLLTASPASEGYENLFALLFLLDRGKRLGRRMMSYWQAHFSLIRKARKWVLRKGHDVKIAEKISDLCLVMKADDYREQLGVEAAVPVRRQIVLPPELQATLKDFEKTFILKLDKIRIEAVNSAALFNKLLQATSGAVYDGEKNIVPIHDEKINSLRALRGEIDGRPLLVAYWFKSSLTRLRAAFPDMVVMDDSGDCVDEWNAGRIPLLAMQAAGTAHGLNLQKGPGCDIAWFDLCWSRELYEQMIGRLARQGQRALVRAHHLIVVDSADEIVYDCLQDKGAGQARLFKYIRAARARLMKDRP